ncbi:SCO7613 C-terminal domain-containing membrane protein [Actinoplanes sp. CA-252034]|uniref:SCO7613 C-terminal domain-containing membrane protein n=1 Tax=Actinoplanes sp. CA-252034 TaxID=3239906 RepID=UPI003D967798
MREAVLPSSHFPGTAVTTSYPCPRCGAAAALPDGCPGCGAGPDPDAAEVIRLDGEIADLTRQLHDARAHVTALDRRLHDARATRNQAAARVVARRTPVPAPSPAPAVFPALAPRLSPAPAPGLSAAPVEPRLSTLTVQNVLFTLGGLLLVVAAAVFTAVAWAQVGVTGRALLLAGATVAILAVPPFAVRRGLTAAAETLAAVGLLMILLDGFAAWAVDFLGVWLWDPRGYAAAVLAVAAAIALGYSSMTRLRGPRIAGLLMAQPVLPLLAAAGDAGLVGWSLAFTGTAALDLAALRMRAARFTADRGGVLAYLCAGATGGAGALLALRAVAVATTPAPAAIAGAALLLPPILLLTWTILVRKPFERSLAAGVLVVAAGLAGARWAWTLPLSLPGGDGPAARLAVVSLALAAVAALLPRARPVADAAPVRTPSTPGPSTLPSPPATSSAASPSAAPTPTSPSASPSSTSPSAASPSTSPSAAASSTSSPSTASSSTTPSAPASSSASSSAAASSSASSFSAIPLPGGAGGGGRRLGEAAGAAWLRRWVPAEIGFGAWAGALLVGVAPGIIVLFGSVAGAIRSVEAARPVFGAPLGGAVSGAGPDLLIAAVVTAFAYALMLPRRAHTNLGLTALAAVGLIIPGALGLAWWAATVAGLIVAAVALVLAGRSRTIEDTGYRSAFGVAGVMHAVITGFGSAEVIAVVCGVITVLGVGAALGLRNAPRSVDVGAGAMIAGLLAVPATVWTALHAADVPVTWRVRVSLGVAVLLCLVAHTIHRRIPVYRWQALGVALVMAGFTPLWAAAGEDPLALYAAAALLLIVALLPIPQARSTAGAVAAVQPVLALLAFTVTDLAVVLLEPWTALANVWSGIPPQQSPVAWSSVVAIATAGLAASAAGAVLVRSGAFGVVAGATSDSATIHSTPGEQAPGRTSGPDGATTPAQTPGETAQPEAAGVAGPARRAHDGATTPAQTPGETAQPGAAGVAGPARRAHDGARAGVSAWRAAGWAAVPFAAVLVPLVFAAGGPAWPAVPIAGLVTGLAGLLTLALTPGRRPVHGLTAALFGALAAAGVAGSTAGHEATIAAFVLVLAAGVAAGLLGRVESDRVAGWLGGAVAVVVVAYTVADLTAVGIAGPPLFVLAAGALVVGVEAVLASRRPREAWAPLVVGHASALLAVVLTETLGWAALVCKLWALVLTVRALRPGETRRGRFGYGVAAGVVALVGWWLLLSSRDVRTTEVYTLPAAALAVVAGWFARRGRPELPSWSAYGAALGAAFLPTLAVIAGSTANEPHYLRRLLLGVGALLVLLVGARARLQAPVVTGGGTLLLVALHELIQFWDLLPRWVPLAVGGLLLVGIATTMEQRRRDLARLRAAITRMT